MCERGQVRLALEDGSHGKLEPGHGGAGNHVITTPKTKKPIVFALQNVLLYRLPLRINNPVLAYAMRGVVALF